jgi:hypothetical protein
MLQITYLSILPFFQSHIIKCFLLLSQASSSPYRVLYFWETCTELLIISPDFGWTVQNMCTYLIVKTLFTSMIIALQP